MAEMEYRLHLYMMNSGTHITRSQSFYPNLFSLNRNTDAAWLDIGAEHHGPSIRITSNDRNLLKLDV